MKKRRMFLLSTMEGRLGVCSTFLGAYKNATFRGGIAEPNLGYRHALAKLKADSGRVELRDEITGQNIWIETVEVLVS